MSDLEADFRRRVKLSVDSDYTGLWELRKDAAELLPTATESELRAFVIPIVEAMLKEGSILAGDLSQNGFDAWNMDAARAAERIGNGWLQVGTPNISDVVWFWSPQRQTGQRDMTPP